jgi:hypothetical protein
MPDICDKSVPLDALVATELRAEEGSSALWSCPVLRGFDEPAGCGLEGCELVGVSGVVKTEFGDASGGVGEAFGDEVMTFAPTAPPTTRVTIDTMTVAQPDVDESHSRNDSAFDLSFGFLPLGIGGPPIGWTVGGGMCCPAECQFLSGGCHGYCPDIKSPR